MRKTTKRWIFAAGAATLLMVATVLSFRPSENMRYLAEAKVMIRPYTNAVACREFETTITKSIPGVIHLRVSPGLSATTGSGVPVVTNSALIQIVVGAATGPEAQRLADQATVSLCATTRQTYGVESVIVEKADRVRTYSYFHDRLKPSMGRLLKE